MKLEGRRKSTNVDVVTPLEMRADAIRAMLTMKVLTGLDNVAGKLGFEKKYGPQGTLRGDTELSRQARDGIKARRGMAASEKQKKAKTSPHFSTVTKG